MLRMSVSGWLWKAADKLTWMVSNFCFLVGLDVAERLYNRIFRIRQLLIFCIRKSLIFDVLVFMMKDRKLTRILHSFIIIGRHLSD